MVKYLKVIFSRIQLFTKYFISKSIIFAWLYKKYAISRVVGRRAWSGERQLTLYLELNLGSFIIYDTGGAASGGVGEIFWTRIS